MSDIPLRTYVEQLDNLIGRKQVDEAIAHCRHILSIYPKHLDTYRMLGKALLEKGRHGDAADIFQRVLSVMPDDFISHVGMSIVREDEANLDAAIWHMERAFEAAPSNGAIQQELCRLYGRRDGVVPPKARLTRGALARMYVQGGLYLQAEAELKAALADSADRIDLLTILAEVYWQTEQPAHAAQTSAAILQKLPYSLEANRILVHIFRAQGRADDAAIYRQRLEAIDPYEAFADPAANGAGAARVDAGKVTVSRLEYMAGMEDSGSPDWLASIGAKFEEPAPARGAESQPDWLTAAGEAAKSAATANYQPAEPDVPDWLKELGPGGTPVASPAPDSAPTPAGASDWLRDLGLGTAPLAPTPEPADTGLPDWLLAASGPLPQDAVPDWMSSAPGATTPTEPVTAPLSPAEQITTSMRAARPSEPAPASPNQPVAAATGPGAPSDDLPDWLKNELPQDAEDDLPDWLKAMTAGPLPAADAPAPAPAPEPAGLAAADIPDWLREAAPAGAAPVSQASPTPDLVPDWLQSATRDSLGTGPLPDWLKIATGELDPRKAAGIGEPEPASAEHEQPAAETPATMAAAASAQPPEPAQPGSPEAATGFPAWIAGASLASATAAAAPSGPTDGAPISAEDQASDKLVPTIASAAEPAPASPSTAEPPQVADQLRDWLNASASVVDHGQGAASEDAGASAESLPDWLQAATRPTPEDTTPAWLRQAPPMPTLAAAESLEEPELELPDWLKSVGAGAPPPDAASRPPFEASAPSGEKGIVTAATAPEAPLLELPDYLQLASPEAIARASQPFELEPEEATPAAEEAEPAAVLPADIPEWLKALAPASADSTAAVASVLPPTPIEAEAPAGGVVDPSLSWLDELTAQPDVTSLPAAQPAPAEAASQPELAASWAGDTASGLGADTLGADLPPWAQTQEPGPTDTIASWLAGKHVPDWLRQPADEAPTLPAVDWEPAAAEPVQPAGEPATPALEPALDAAPELGEMDSDETFRWLEQLAARQGAPREELLTSPEPAAPSTPPSAVEAGSIAVVAAELSVDAMVTGVPPAETEPAAPPAPAADAESLPDWLRKMEAAMPAQPLVDTAPSKGRRSELAAPEAPAAPPAEPAAETIAVGTPPLMAAVDSAAPTTPESADLDADADAALRWLEGLAAQQGANPEELLTTPEERTLELPSWIAAEQAAAPPAETQSIAEQPVPVQVELPAPATRSAELPSLITPEEAAGPIAEAAHAEAVHAEAPMAEAMLVEAPVAEAAHADETPIADAIHAEAPTADVAQAEAAHTEAVTPEALHVEAPLAEVAHAETPIADAIHAVAPTAEVAQAEAPIAEAARAEAPIAETMHAESPTAEAAHIEVPIAEAPVAETPMVAATTELMPAAAGPDAAAFDDDEAMRWLEGLAAQQGANPEELLTAPEDRPLEAPAWIAAEQAGAPAAPDTAAAATFEAPPAELEQAASAVPEPEPAGYVEPPEWLKSLGSTDEAAAEAVEETTPATAAASPDFDKLARLAERLAATRRTRERELEARFAEQRAQQEAARRELEEKLEARRQPVDPGSAAEPQPVAAEPVAVVEPPAAAPPLAEPPAAPAFEPPAVEPLATGRRRAHPSIRMRPQHTIPSVEAGPAPETLARGRAALSAKDYETAVTALSALVEQNQHVELVMSELEAASADKHAPVPVLRLLGDTYMRTDQLQKALDTYRLALSRL